MTTPTNYKFNDCRLLGHLWHIVPSDWTPRYGDPMTTRCERCDIERRDEINRNTGDVESRRYTYPDGYLFQRDEYETLPRRADFRLTWLMNEIKRNRKRKASK